MTSRLCAVLRRISSAKVLAALAGVYVLFMFVLFPALGGDGNALPLDLRFWYDADIVYATFDDLGVDGRRRYMIGALTVDVLYPLVYSTLLAVWLTLQLKNESRMSCALRLSPFAILCADLLENSGIAVMLTRYPERMEILAWFTATSTATKWTLAILVVSLTVVLTLRSPWRKGPYW